MVYSYETLTPPPSYICQYNFVHSFAGTLDTALIKTRAGTDVITLINALIVQSYNSRIVAEKLQIVLLDPGLSAQSACTLVQNCVLTNNKKMSLLILSHLQISLLADQEQAHPMPTSKRCN